ncbi:MAG: tetratricopeptide repeat protein, partial [Chitinophagaceae bacterium]|nr:tetratricopeptide repeat protein [Chitinophagaceae bacterium]
MRFIGVILVMCIGSAATAQKVNQYIEKGNQEYRQRQFKKANEAYDMALRKGNNHTARFNAGNAKQKLGQYADAGKAYEAVASAATDPVLKAQAYYNMGVSYIRQNKLPEAIDAFKRSLRLAPGDGEARENLQKAMKQLKQSQQQSDKQDNKDKKKPTRKDVTTPQKGSLTKEDAEKMLNDL